jgi:hypothetical protein
MTDTKQLAAYGYFRSRLWRQGKWNWGRNSDQIFSARGPAGARQTFKSLLLSIDGVHHHHHHIGGDGGKFWSALLRRVLICPVHSCRPSG